MSDWYVSSAAFASVTAWSATAAKSVGAFVKATASPTGKEYVWRCTTAGTTGGTEPTWSTAYANNQTRTDGTVTWTNVTGQSTYGWSAAAGSLYSIANANSVRPVAGDRVFLSSDHSESWATGTFVYGFNSTSGFGLIQIISVNRAGSVPPVAADITNGASISLTSTGANSISLDAVCDMFWQGVTFSITGSSNANMALTGTSSGVKSQYFKNCAFALTTTGTCRLMSSASLTKAILDNTTVQFGSVNDFIGNQGSIPFELHWINTPSALAGSTFPTNLIQSNTGGNQLTFRGLDLSSVTGTLLAAPSVGTNMSKILFDSCKIASGVTRYGTPSGLNSASDEIEFVNCYDGTNVLNERYTAAGAVTTDRSTTLSGGAQDDVGSYSLKLVSSSRSDIASFPLDSFWLDVQNTATGSSKTATVEIISSASLNDTDIKLLLEYMDSSGSPVTDFLESLSSILAVASALPSSSATWNSPPGTPQKQKLEVTFTPQRAGRVRGLVRLGKVSTTVWVNPQITIT
jgi:hypothetical protein